MERTFVILKPCCLQRGLVGEVISRFEKRGLKLVALKMALLDDEILKVHYSHLLDKPFFPWILDSMKAGGDGYCGIMCNFHPKLYSWLGENFEKQLTSLIMKIVFGE